MMMSQIKIMMTYLAHQSGMYMKMIMMSMIRSLICLKFAVLRRKYFFMSILSMMKRLLTINSEQINILDDIDSIDALEGVDMVDQNLVRM